MTDKIFVISAAEMERLHGPGPLACTIYFWLRTWMDYGTGQVGRRRPVSLGMLRAYTETHTPKGSGTQIEQASERGIRTAIARLERAGLLQRLPGDTLAFKMPLALTSASARPFQTRHEPDTNLPTEPDTAEATQAKALTPETGTRRRAWKRTNLTHIMFHEGQHLPARPVDNFSGQGTVRRRDGLAMKERDTDRLLKLGQKRGIEARPGESWSDYGARVRAVAS